MACPTCTPGHEDIWEALDAGRLEDAERLLERYVAADLGDRRWALGLLSTVLRRRREACTNPLEETRLREREQSLAGELVEGVGEVLPWLHAWERARQLNNRAWAMYEETPERRVLEEALGLLDDADRFWPYFLSHADTRVRILLRLGRTLDAWEVVRSMEALQPGWPDFEEFRQDPAWGAWARGAGEPRLPPGPATARPVIPRAEPRLLTPPDTRLSRPERRVLLVSRPGRDEWHRARNAALLACILDLEMSPEAALALGPRDLDLTQGVVLDDGRDISVETRDKLRHWLMWATSNHPASVGASAPVAPLTRGFLFFRWDLEPLALTDLEALLEDLGQATGLGTLEPRRLEPLRFARVGHDLLEARTVRGPLRRVERPTGPMGSTVASRLPGLVHGLDTWFPYTYEVGGRGYAFLVCIPAGVSSPGLPPCFPVSHDQKAPWRHVAEDPGLAPFREATWLLGRATWQVHGPADAEWAWPGLDAESA